MIDLILLGAAHVHVPDHARVARSEGARVVAVLDHEPARAAEWAKEFNARIVADVAEANADAAIVASENARHEAYVGLALDEGLPVLCEKPLATDAAAARRMVARAANAGCILDTAFSLRADTMVCELSRRVRGGLLGRVLTARARYAHDGALADWLDLSGWMTDPAEASYGGFGDEAVHVLDWLIWTLGPVSSGTARFGRTMGFAVDDHGVAALELKSGVTVTLEGGWIDRDIHCEVEILGTKARALLCMDAYGGRIEVIRRNGGVMWSAETGPLNAGAAMRPFLRAVREGAPPLVDADHSASVVEALDLLYGREV